MLKLTSIEVDDLLGRFDHRVPIDPEWDFVIIHGPNGVGKTRLLELVHALAGKRFGRVLDTPFSRLALDFEGGVRLSVVRSGELPLPGVPRSPDTDSSLTVTLEGVDQEPVESIIHRSEVGNRSPARAIGRLERELPLIRVGDREWVDQDVGDHLTFEEVRDRYGEMFPPGYFGPEDELAEPIEQFIDGLSVHLIETQRLISQQITRHRDRAPNQSPVTVTRYSQDLTHRLSRALAENTTTSQRLDRSFPERVLNSEAPEDITDEQIRDRYAEQSKLRDRLAEISVLDAAADIPLPSRDLENWERRVLWTYLEDAGEKLATFQSLLDRVQLMRDIVNARFLFKKLHIDREQGFRFETDEGYQIGPAALSSGEQHELVLVYDLLFKVNPGSLVLIDEPEISLHVGWQRQFLNDVSQIAHVADLRFVVATHSPQVINKWAARMVPLFEDADDEREILP